MIITISDEAFISMREAVDQQLCTTLKMMKIREADKATISLDIKIRMEDVKTTDLKTGEILMVKNPEFEYSVKHKLEYKNPESETGEIKRTNSYLACEDGIWKIKRIEDGQMTISDYVQQGGKHDREPVHDLSKVKQPTKEK